MIRVKICGITNLEDAIFAQDCGADALGFIFYSKSKRYVMPDKVKKIVQILNPFISKVGVFVNCTAGEINEIVTYCGLSQIQLQGSETLEFAESLKMPVIRALNFNSLFSEKIDIWGKYPLLVDSGNKETPGGTGHPLPWQKLKINIGDLKIILAGGLTVENVKQAIKIIGPSAVDVSSGVEQSPGIKDKLRVKQFIDTVKK